MSDHGKRETPSIDAMLIQSLRADLAKARSEQIELARIYDPNCDEYDYETQVQAMKAASQTVEAMQDLARRYRHGICRA